MRKLFILMILAPSIYGAEPVPPNDVKRKLISGELDYAYATDEIHDLWRTPYPIEPGGKEVTPKDNQAHGDAFLWYVTNIVHDMDDYEPPIGTGYGTGYEEYDDVRTMPQEPMDEG